MKVLIVIPTYNERNNIRLLINEILKEFKKNKIKGKILVVDDTSPDGTGFEVKKIMKSNKNVFLLERKKKEGLGVAYIAGFKKAFELNSDLIFGMDADFSHNPKYIIDFINKINDGFDVVIGTRYSKGGGFKNRPFYRGIMSKGANFLVKLILNLPVTDVTNAYRAYKTDVLKSIDIDGIESRGYEFLSEILLRINKKGFKITEIPTIFDARRGGKSKLSLREIPFFFYRAIKLRVNSKIN
ncbi:MAG: polyprenol monophosphomannose synthase [Candidatus Diapherotrites archaeon]